jgi:hypothetical protein
MWIQKVSDVGLRLSGLQCRASTLALLDKFADWILRRTSANFAFNIHSL